MSSPSPVAVSSPPAVVASTASPRRCALVIGIDGCRPDCLTRDHAPTLYDMMHGKQVSGRASAYSLSSQVGDICWSGPGWTSMATGVWRDKHGVSGNTFPTAQFDTYPPIFTRIKSHAPMMRTASIVNWAPINQFIFTRDHADHVETHEENDGAITESACRLLREVDMSHGGCVFVHLDDVDLAGHTYDYGPSVPEYVASIRKTDERVALLLRALQHDRSSYGDEDWLIVVTTDHGGLDYTHETNVPENRTNFVIVNGADVVPGEIYPSPVLVDVAPTILAHLDIKIASSWHLDGRPIGLKLTGRGSYMNLEVSQDPTNRYPIPAAELEEGPAPTDKTEEAIAAAAAPVITSAQTISSPISMATSP